MAKSIGYIAIVYGYVGININFFILSAIVTPWGVKFTLAQLGRSFPPVMRAGGAGEAGGELLVVDDFWQPVLVREIRGFAKRFHNISSVNPSE